MCAAVLRIQIRDPLPFWPRDPVPFWPRDPVPFWPWDPGSVKNPDPDLGWTTWIIFPIALKLYFGSKYLNSFILIRDPGWKNSDPGWKKLGSGIWDKHPGSATRVRSFPGPFRSFLCVLCLLHCLNTLLFSVDNTVTVARKLQEIRKIDEVLVGRDRRSRQGFSSLCFTVGPKLCSCQIFNHERDGTCR